MGTPVIVIETSGCVQLFGALDLSVTLCCHVHGAVKNRVVGYYSIYIARPKSRVVSLLEGQLPDAYALLAKCSYTKMP